MVPYLSIKVYSGKSVDFLLGLSKAHRNHIIDDPGPVLFVLPSVPIAGRIIRKHHLLILPCQIVILVDLTGLVLGKLIGPILDALQSRPHELLPVLIELSVLPELIKAILPVTHREAVGPIYDYNVPDVLAASIARASLVLTYPLKTNGSEICHDHVLLSI